MPPFQPNQPCSYGCAWFPDRESVAFCAGELEAAAWILEASDTRAIDEVSLAMMAPNDQLRGGAFELEIYDATDLPGDQLATVTFRPSEDAFVQPQAVHGFLVGTGRDDVGPFFGFVNNSTLTPVVYQDRTIPHNEFLFPIFGAGMEYSARVSGITGSAADDKLVTKVSIFFLVSEQVAYELIESAIFTPYIEFAGTRYTGDPTTVTDHKPEGVLIRQDYMFCPDTGVSWKLADIYRFETGGDASFGVVVAPTHSSNNLPSIFQMFMQVEYVDDASDKRIRNANWPIQQDRDSSRVPGWCEAEFYNPRSSVVSAWSKTSGTDYLMVFRKRSGDGNASLRFLSDSRQLMPATPTIRRVDARIYPASQHLASYEENGSFDVPSICFEASVAANLDGDIQPYASISDDGGEQVGWSNIWTHVKTGVEVEQEITTAGGGGGTFGFARLLVALIDPTVDDDLIIELRRRSDNVQMGSTITLTQADLETPRRAWQLIEARMSTPATLAAATQYYWWFHSDATDGWRVQVLSTLLVGDTGGPTNSVFTQGTFGGNTDRAKVDGVEHNELDVAITTHIDPDAPSALTATIVDGGHAENCWQYVHLAWDAAVISDCGNGLLYYEIERQTFGSTEWERIFHLESGTSFDDYTAPRNVNNVYRIRTRREGDLGCSDWVESNGVVPLMECCGYLFTSNEVPTLSCFFADIGPRTFRPRHELTEVELYGRNGPMSYGTLEDDGDVFSLDVLVGAIGGVGGTIEANPVDRQAFTTLNRLASVERLASGAKATPAHVVVLDSLGNRWMGRLKIGDEKRDAAKGEQHIAQVTVSETGDTEVVVDVNRVPSLYNLVGGLL